MRLVLAICGYSGSGKTTLIETLLPWLAEQGLRVGVLKHDTHRLTLDPAGKDTARFFAAGAAAVCAHDPTQHFVRVREAGPIPLTDVLVGLPLDLDFVLVEGHKDSPLPKIVLEHPEPQPEIVGPEVLATLPWSGDRTRLAKEHITKWLQQAWKQRPLGAAVFFGGQTRSDSSKTQSSAELGAALATLTGRLAPIADRIIVVGNAPPPQPLEAPLAVLPDVPELEGPLSGLLGLLRFDPERAWLCIACDQTTFAKASARWLVSQRRPGAWAVLPIINGHREPFGAIYEPTLLPALERAVAGGKRALHRVVKQSPLATPHVPVELLKGWHNASTS